MKFGLLSDVHATSSIPISRKDNIMETFERKFSFVLNYAEKEKLIILQAGDLSDSPRNWNILNYLSKQLKQREIKLLAVFGQHDLYMRGNPESSPTSMSILMNAKLIHRLGEAPISIENVDIYGSDFEGSIPKVINKKVKNILVLHSSIAEKAEWSDHDYTAPAYFMKNNPDFDLVLVGDIHRQFIYQTGERYLVNTGPLLRMDASKHSFNHKPAFFVWDSETNNIEKIEIPHEPAKNVLTREHIDSKNISNEKLKTFVSGLHKLKPIKDLQEKRIRRYLKKNVKEKRVQQIIEEIIGESRAEN